MLKINSGSVKGRRLTLGLMLEIKLIKVEPMGARHTAKDHILIIP
jgi:hypothetical protein